MGTLNLQREREREVALRMEGRHEDHHGHDPDKEREEGVLAGHVRNDSTAASASLVK